MKRDIFRPWNIINLLPNSILHKGGGGDIPETAAQHTIAQNAAKAWNRYVSTYVPNVETPYIQDVMADPQHRIDKIQGQVNADVAKATGPTFNPSGGPIDMGNAFTSAKANSDAQVSGKQAVEAQRLGAMQGIVDMGRGKQSTVDTGFEKLASTQASDALNKAETNWNSNAAWSNALGSMSGVAANFASNGGKGTTNSSGVQSWDGKVNSGSSAKAGV